MSTWVNDSFSQIAGVKWDDETGDSLQHRKGGSKMGRPCKRRFTTLVGYRQAQEVIGAIGLDRNHRTRQEPQYSIGTMGLDRKSQDSMGLDRNHRTPWDSIGAIGLDGNYRRLQTTIGNHKTRQAGIVSTDSHGKLQAAIGNRFTDSRYNGNKEENADFGQLLTDFNGNKRLKFGGAKWML